MSGIEVASAPGSYLEGIITTNSVEQYLQSQNGMIPPNYNGPSIFSIPSPNSMDSLFASATNTSLDLFAYQQQQQIVEDTVRHTTTVISTSSSTSVPSTDNRLSNDQVLHPPPDQEQRLKQLEIDKKALEKTECEDECDGCMYPFLTATLTHEGPYSTPPFHPKVIVYC